MTNFSVLLSFFHVINHKCINYPCLLVYLAGQSTYISKYVLFTRYRHRFFNKVGHETMYLSIYVVEISIFSLNNVTVRLTKIVNNLLEPT